MPNPIDSKAVPLPSGKLLVINIASMAQAKALFMVVSREIRSVNITSIIGDAKKRAPINPERAEKEAATGADELAGEQLNVFKDIAFQVLGSDEVDKALEPCIRNCTYNGKAITDQTFMTLESRGDYQRIAWEVMLYNLTPFFVTLHSLFLENFGKVASALRSA